MMPTVHFFDAEGAEHEVHAAIGDSLMQIGIRSGIPGAEGECGGELSCATCHVTIDRGWYEKLRPRSEDEEDLLEADEDFSELSRLGCQVKITDALDGIVVRLPHRS